ncbi:helix-turn-helix transcriptional regulator [Desulfopila inferna]|uniref:helix-turn-helix transcriptional regulator n=1 Tax=Desulfopila inferna TaxID=468528 RepID=UPI001966CDD9|nr:helix-turn-helix transcriptional regulator [Desulfopila inferna]MBM9604895.1 helix-turn-helix transcriptional regulator [Desulfopila inferna]
MEALPQYKFITTKEVADLLKVNEKMVYALVSDKGLPATKITGKWLFPRRLVEEWLELNMINGPVQAAVMSSETGRLLLAGSDDPLFQQTLTLFHRKFSETVAFFANVGSMGGLKSLRRGLCHIGVCHLLQDDNQEYNFDFAEQELERTPVFINFSRREQGLLVQRGNPKNIQNVADLGRNDIIMVNRPLGTGTRLLLDYEIAGSDISAAQIKGYTREVSRHIDAGLEVLSGRCDAAPAIRAVAGMLDLDFISLRWERFDLLVSRERFFERGIQNFLGILQEKRFMELAGGYLGYDISQSGKMIFPDNLKRNEP